LRNFALAFALFFAPRVAQATTVLPNATSAPTVVDVEAAIATTPSGSVRWTRVTVDSQAPALWLVPARPGATIDWAPDTWLSALDDATRTVVRGPVPTDWTTAPEWTRSGPRSSALSATVMTSEAMFYDETSRRGSVLSGALVTRIHALYGQGWELVAIDLPGQGRTSTPTIRVRDSATVPELPFALFAGATTSSRLTVFTVTEGAATVHGALEVSASSVVWEHGTNNYDALRESALRPGGWLRESSSHVSFTALVASEDRALLGVLPERAFVTRFAGSVPASSLFADARIEASGPREPLIWARGSTSGSTSPPLVVPPPATSDGVVATAPADEMPITDEGCGGGSSSDSDYDDGYESGGDACASDSTSSSDVDGTDSCASDPSGSSDDESDDEYEDEDDYEDDGDDDDSDVTSSTTSDSSSQACSLGPSKRALHTHRTTLGMNRRSTPISRLVLLIAAACLCLRRRGSPHLS
jgi:hypothetical protein